MTTQLFLCVFFCVIASTFSFRSNFVKFCPQRYGSRALTALVKAPQFEPLRGKTITRNVRLPGVLLCKNDVNDEVNAHNVFAPSSLTEILFQQLLIGTGCEETGQMVRRRGTDHASINMMHTLSNNFTSIACFLVCCRWLDCESL